MKKLGHVAKLLHVRRSIKFIERRTTINRRRLRAKRRYSVISWLIRKIKAPEKIKVLDAKLRASLFEFFNAVDTSLLHGNSVEIDFQDVKELHPCGTLVFLSKLDLWLAKYPHQMSCVYPKDDVIEQLLQHLSVLTRLGLTSRKVINHERVRYWHFHSGLNVNARDYQDLTRSVIERIEHPSQGLFGDCLNEAVTNAVNHAYALETTKLPPRQQRKWWMLSQLRDGHLFVAIYDCGVGIPGSLRHKPDLMEYFRLRHYKDSRVIRSAVSGPRTSTKLSHRGKGLPEMLEFSRELHAGGLSIWSGKGGVVFDAKTEKEKRVSFTTPLPGTLVLWEIPFRLEQLR